MWRRRRVLSGPQGGRRTNRSDPRLVAICNAVAQDGYASAPAGADRKGANAPADNDGGRLSCEASALKAAIDAAAFGLIRPVLYGPVNQLRSVAESIDLELPAMPSNLLNAVPRPWMRRGGRSLTQEA